MNITLDITLKKFNKIYHEQEIISGSIIVVSRDELKHEGIFLTVDGAVNYKSNGLFDSFYNAVKPIHLMSNTYEIVAPGRLSSRRTELPFEISLKPKKNKNLYETYHGYCFSIQYFLKCDIKRSLLSKDVSKSIEFYIESTGGEKATKKPIDFVITPDSLESSKDRLNLPRFFMKGKLDSTSCIITEPFTGQLMVERCDSPIKSIELQLIRIESCLGNDDYTREATEIQNVQLVEGDLCRGLSVPIYLIFPRIITCPTLISTYFKIEFELSIILIFDDGQSVSENFPIKLTRF